jgi:uncharacterized membrane protein
MKEVEIIIGIIFIVLGAILFSMNWDTITKLFGFVLMIVGVIIYVVAVDSIDEKKKKKKKVVVPSTILLRAGGVPGMHWGTVRTASGGMGW